jgi:hypothetical protein
MVILPPTHVLCALALATLLKMMVTGIDPVFDPNTSVESFQLFAKYLSELKQVVNTKLIANNQTTSEPVNVRINSYKFGADKFLRDIYTLQQLLSNRTQLLLLETKVSNVRDFLMLLADTFGFIIPDTFMSRLELACQIRPQSIPPDRFAWLMAITCAIVLMRPDFSIGKTLNHIPKIAPHLRDMLKECDQTDITHKQWQQICCQLFKLLNIMFSVVGTKTIAPLTMFVMPSSILIVNATAAPANNMNTPVVTLTKHR